MIHYVASVRSQYTHKVMRVEGNFKKKSEFWDYLRSNGYNVRFISTPQNFDEDYKVWSKTILNKDLDPEAARAERIIKLRGADLR